MTYLVIKARHFFMSIESVLESKSTPPAMLFAKKKSWIGERMFRETKAWKEQVMMKRRKRLLLGYTVGRASRRMGKEQPDRWPSPTHMHTCTWCLALPSFRNALCKQLHYTFISVESSCYFTLPIITKVFLLEVTSWLYICYIMESFSSSLE